MKIYGLITVRSGSSRLPRKCFLPFGDTTVLAYVIRRAIKYGITPIVCTTKECDDDDICNIADEENVHYYRGSVKDKLIRWRDACRIYNIDRFTTIDADDPFFDGELSIKSHKLLSNKYDFVKHPAEQPYGGFYEGCVGYSMTYEIVNKACQSKNTDDTEMMWLYLEKVPSIRVTHIVADKIDDVSPIRLTLDYKEDYWLMLSLLRMIGNTDSREDIIKVFVRNPNLYMINWFRNDEYKSLHTIE